MKRGLALVVLCAVVPAAGCGSGSAGSASSDSSPIQEPASKQATPDFTGCPESKKSYGFGQEMIATGEGKLDEGNENAAARRLIQLGKNAERRAISGCSTERELAASEAKMCANSPQELEEAFRLEETKANAEYIGVYEATCGKHVNVP